MESPPSTPPPSVGFGFAGEDPPSTPKKKLPPTVSRRLLGFPALKFCLPREKLRVKCLTAKQLLDRIEEYEVSDFTHSHRNGKKFERRRKMRILMSMR